MNMARNGVCLTVLGGFDVVHVPDRVSLATGAQRLLAFLALHEGGVYRAVAAERLWPDSPPARALGNLRTALWRCRRVGSAVIDHAGPGLRLSPATHVDLYEARLRAQQILEPMSPPASGDIDALIADLSQEMLPGWTEEWLVLERERWDQLRLHSLEKLAQRLQAAQDFLPALQVAMTAIDIEPIRETAHRLVIEVHAAEGNVASAVQHYQHYRVLLQRELGVPPSSHMRQLVRSVTSP